MSAKVEIFEVGPRDGLQNEKRRIPTAEQVALVETYAKHTGRRINPDEAASATSHCLYVDLRQKILILVDVTDVSKSRLTVGYDADVKRSSPHICCDHIAVAHQLT